MHKGTAAGSKELFLSFPLVDLVDRTELGFPVIYEVGYVGFGATVLTQCVWKVAKAHLRVRRDLPTVLFAMRIIGHV